MDIVKYVRECTFAFIYVTQKRWDESILERF